MFYLRGFNNGDVRDALIRGYTATCKRDILWSRLIGLGHGFTVHISGHRKMKMQARAVRLRMENLTVLLHLSSILHSGMIMQNRQRTTPG